MSTNLIHLPTPVRKGSISLEETLARRKSIRGFKQEALRLSHMGQVLWTAQGVTHDDRRTGSSAGATYPMELFVVCCKDGVAGLESGV